MARQGYASLFWDRPGVGRSTGDAGNLNWRRGDRATEALNALAFARLQPEIVSSDIGVLGISQAGWVIPQMLARKAPISRLLMFSVPTGTVWDQTVYIVKRQLLLSGRSSEEQQESVDDLRGIERLLRAKASFDRYLQFQQRFERRRWLRAALELPQGDYFQLSRLDYESEEVEARYDIAPDLRVLVMPTLAVYGTEDSNVDASKGIEAFTLLKATKRGLQIFLIPGVNHFMRPASAMPESARPRALPSAHDLQSTAVSRELLTIISGWLRNKK